MMRRPDSGTLTRALEDAIGALSSADARMRPPDAREKPGGVVYLPQAEYVVIVPDLHARGDFLRAVLRIRSGEGTVADDLASGRACVVCVGDAFHAEGRALGRWRTAYEEFVAGEGGGDAMDEEMAESLDLLLEIARLQAAHPARFHFLKGNHENVANEWHEGNFPFRKFALEGEMVRDWILRVLGQELFSRIYSWEKALPLAAAGDNFLVVHAEPQFGYAPEEIVNAYEDPEIIAGLTWTGNGDAEDGSVAQTLAGFFPDCPASRMFGGHRPVRDRYALRQADRYVQINTPNRWVVAVVRDIRDFDPERDIVDIGATSGGRSGEDS